MSLLLEIGAYIQLTAKVLSKSVVVPLREEAVYLTMLSAVTPTL